MSPGRLVHLGLVSLVRLAPVLPVLVRLVRVQALVLVLVA